MATLAFHAGTALDLLDMTRDGQRLMVVMPHPDDECFGCASTIARYSAEGATISLDLSASDSNSNALTFSAAGLPVFE